MLLRPRQVNFVERVTAALNDRANTLGVAPTGAGKTVMLSAAARQMPKPGLVLQHRDELVSQNVRTFLRINPGVPVAIFDADQKRWASDGWTFGMIQSVVRAAARPKLRSIIIDEAHHASSNSYLKVIGEARRDNPDLQILGVTATPIRGDKRTLKAVFDNVADVISIRELIESGFLVRPRTYVIDVGVQSQLREVRKLASDFDMEAVAEIMDKRLVTEKVVEQWKEKAGDRRTVVFAANVEHATHVCDAFRGAGVAAAIVTGEMADAERKGALVAFDSGRLQVLVNVAVLTEGWDCQPVGCVVLLRPSSYKSTMIQMIGRGLRPVDPERYPGVVKHDCIVLDFGTSILTHGSVEADGSFGDGATKSCPECSATMPACCHECPLCGYEFPREPAEEPAGGALAGEPEEKAELSDFVLTEIDLFKQSPYRWEELWPGIAYVCNSFEAWAAVVNYQGEWFAVAGCKENGIRCIAARTEKMIALAAGDDHMREHGSVEEAGKTKRWLSQPPSDKQLQHLGLTPMQATGITRYRAACLMTWRWAESSIRNKIVHACAAAPRIAA